MIFACAAQQTCFMKSTSFSRAVLLSCFAIALAGNLPAADAAKESSHPSSSENTDHPQNVRVLVLKGTWDDHPSAPGLDPVSLLLGDMEKPNSFYDLVDTVDDLAKDKTIQAVFLDLSAPDLRMNLAQLEELDHHLDALRKAGKKTTAWIENANTISYSIAAACDTVLMADMGTLDLPSLSLTTFHFRDAMNLLGIDASVVRVGAFKGATEPFTLSEMSEELRAHYLEMLKSMNNALVERIAAGRKTDHDQVRKWQAERLFTAEQAKAAGLVDEAIPYGTARDTVAKRMGGEVHWILPQKAPAKQLSFFDLIGKLMGQGTASAPESPTVAVLHLDGIIVDGAKERPGFLVSGPMVRVIKEIADDNQIRAVVVRINSPGGSATASEAIRQGLEKLAKRKPLAVSMGEVAASGGYWVSCLGRPVYAEPGTLTGSIGVFAMKLSVGPLLDRIGLHVSRVTLDDSASAMSLDRPWKNAEKAKMQSLVQDIYGKFIRHVADSRKMSSDKVDDIAGGRVWSGAQAKELGLVDELGGLDAALEAVAKEAKLAPGYKVIHRPRPKSLFEMLDLFGSDEELRDILTPSARSFLRASGFDLSLPLQLVRESLSGNPNALWLLAPNQLRIR